jgi:thioredoxin-like negative regulator of GroEL
VTVLAFTATWCEPCRANAAEVNALRRRGLSVCDIDIDSNPIMAERHRIIVVPTYVVLDASGSEIMRTNQPSELAQFLNR